MLPEQRGLLMSWLNRFRFKQRSGRGNTAGGSNRRKRSFTRLACVEPLEDRRLLTATLYVDFGDLLPNLTQTESQWATYGLTVPTGQQSWIQGPKFNLAGNPQITYTSFRTVMNNPANAAILAAFDPGPDPATDPFQYNAGPEPPIDKIAQMEDSIFEILEREFAPFNITIAAASARNMGEVQAALDGNNRVVNPYLVTANAIATTPNPNFYNLTNGNPAGNVPPGFDQMSMLTATGITFDIGSSEDIYLFIGGWTSGGQQVAVTNGTKLGFSNNIGNPNDLGGEYPSYADPNDPLYGGGGMGMPMPVTYADNGAAVAADTTAQVLLALDPTLTGNVPFQFNTAIADIAAQEVAIDYGLQHTSTGEQSIGNPFFDPDVDLLTGSDVMRDGPQEAAPFYPSLDNVAFFTRAPLTIGDSNQDISVTQNAYDELTGAADITIDPIVEQDGTVDYLDGGSLADIIGPNTGVGYVTGTGAFDHISLVNDTSTGMIDVTVDAYRDNTFSPSSMIGSPISYQIDPSSIFALLVETGNSDDQVDIDPTISLNAAILGSRVLSGIQIFGGGGVNNFSMFDAGNGDDVSVTPANLATFAFSGVERFDTTLELNPATTATTINLQEFQQNSIVHLEGFNSLTYNMPQFLGDDFTLTGQNGSDLGAPPSPGGTDMVIGGTVGATIAAPDDITGVCGVEFIGIPTVTLAVLNGATNDSVTVDSTKGYADGLANLEFDLGPGNDTLTINGPIDLTPGTTGGIITYDGGTGSDTLNVAGNSDWTLTDAGLTDGLGNSVQFANDSVENVNLSATDDPTFSVENWSGNATITGSATGGDTFNIGDAAPVSGNVTVDASAGFLGDTFNIDNFSGIGNFTGGSGNNTFNVNTNTITLSKAATGTGTSTAYVGTPYNLSTTTGSKNAKLNTTFGLFVGEAVIGPGVSAGTTISAILNTTNITLSAVATGTGTNATLIGTIGTTIMQTTLTTTTGLKTVDEVESTILSAGETVVGDSNLPINTTIASVSNITLDGGSGDDTFYVKSWNGIGNLDGGAGDDTFVFGTLSTTSPSGDGDIDAITQPHDIFGDANGDTLILDDSGSNAAEDYTIGPTSVSDTSTFGGITFDGTLESIKLIGSQGANTFVVTPNTKTAITVDGQLPTTTPGDELDVNLTGTKGAKLTPNGPFGGTLTFTSGQRPITYSNIETTVPDLTQLAQQQSQQQQQMNTLLGELENDPLLVEAADPGTASAPLVKLYDVKTNTVLFSFDAYETTFKGGVRAEVVPDVTGDGVPDIVVAPGSGRLGEVKLYSGAMLAGAAATTGTHLVANPDTALISVSGLIPVTTVNGSAIATVGILGQSVTGSTIALGTTVSSMTNSTTVALSLPATGSATITAVVGPAVVTLKTTKGKTAATISKVLSVDGLIVGQSVAGSDSVIVTTTSGSKTVNVSSIAGLTVGEPVTGLNIPGNTTISIIGVNTVTLSAAATGSGVVIADFDPVASNSIINALGSSMGGITITLSTIVKSTGTNDIFAAGFMPEATTYKSGLYVAAGDLTGSGDIDIVTSRSSTVPNVEVFDVNNLLLGDDAPDAAFNPYTTKFLTGAQIAVGDVDGDGVDQIVTAPGTGQTVQIKVFDYNTVLDDFENNLAVVPERTFLGFESTFKNGVSLALGDTNGDGTDEIMLGAGSGGTSRVRVLDGYGDLLEQFQAFTAGNTSAALRIAAVDVNGEAELFVGQGIVSKSHVIEGFDPLTGMLVDTFMETDPAMTDGIFLG